MAAGCAEKDKGSSARRGASLEPDFLQLEHLPDALSELDLQSHLNPARPG